MKNTRRKTLCCGQGSGADNPEQAQAVIRQAEGKRLFTYCAGCAEALGAEHLLDHILRPKGRRPFRIHGYPRAYAERLMLKRRLVKIAGL